LLQGPGLSAASLFVATDTRPARTLNRHVTGEYSIQHDNLLKSHNLVNWTGVSTTFTLLTSVPAAKVARATPFEVGPGDDRPVPSRRLVDTTVATNLEPCPISQEAQMRGKNCHGAAIDGM
jgi:hypothetical protein